MMNFFNVNILWNVHLIIKVFHFKFKTSLLRGRFRKVSKKKLKIIVNNQEILKMYFKNNCKSFAVYVGG
jgi:hypothetical protein